MSAGGIAVHRWIDVVVFDVNETLFGLDPVAEAFEEAGIGADTMPLWFARVLRDGIAAGAAGRFAPFPDVASHHLEQLAVARGVAEPKGVVDVVISAFERVRPHPEVGPAFARLHDAGVRIATFTNGTAAITRAMLERGGVLAEVEAMLEVADAGVWKPSLDAYRYALRALDVPAETAAMIAVHPWDVQGAMAVGMIGGWVDRAEAPYPPYLPSPDVQGPDLVAVADTLIAEYGR